MAIPHVDISLGKGTAAVHYHNRATSRRYPNVSVPPIADISEISQLLLILLTPHAGMCCRGQRNGELEAMARWASLVATLALTGCAPTWPSEQFPPAAEVAKVLFAEGGGGIRETCEAIVVELTDESAPRLTGAMQRVNGKLVVAPPTGWASSPAPDGISSPNYFEAAFGGCNEEGKHPPGDLQGALRRPGAFYKIINQGEGIAIVVPRAKLAGFFYFG